MTAESIAPAFRATAILIVVLLLLHQQLRSRLNPAFVLWLWWSACFNGFVLLLVIFHPGRNIFVLDLLFVTGTEIGLKKKAWNMTSVTRLAFTFVFIVICLGQFDQHFSHISTMLKVPMTVWLALLLCGFLMLVTPAFEQLRSLNFVIFAHTILTFTHLSGPFLSGLSIVRLYNLYWLSVPIILCWNLVEWRFIPASPAENT